MSYLASGLAYANAEFNHTVRVGFIVEASASILDNKGNDKLIRAVRLSNERTYHPLGIHLVTSFVRSKETIIQYSVNTTADIISQARHDAKSDLDILDSTQTDILFYIAPQLPNNACGSAEIPTLVEHFESRFLLGVIEAGFCINADVLSHEIGHLFGAHHDVQHVPRGLTLLSDTAIGCLVGENGGSLMSYANLRSTAFSSQSFCGALGYDNEGLVRKNAHLITSLYERSLDNQASGGGSGSGGSIQILYLLASLLLTYARVR